MTELRALALLLLLVPATASAEEYRPSRITQEWYGWQNLACDGAALSMAVLAPSSKYSSEKFAYSALFLYTFGGPTVHWAHGRVGTGFSSLGLRVGIPVGLSFAFCAASGSDGEYGCLGALLVGGIIGITGAIAIDAGGLAFEDVEVPRPRPYAIRLQPTASITKQAATFGVAASF